MQVQVGKYYKTRDGRKVGPVYANWCDSECWPFRIGEGMWYKPNGSSCPGSVHRARKCDDLIAEWTDGPIRTVTRTVTETTIEPGRWDGVIVDRADGKILVSYGKHDPSSAELKAAAAVLLELAGALSDEE